MKTSKQESGLANRYFECLRSIEAAFRRWARGHGGKHWLPFLCTMFGAFVTVLTLSLISYINAHARELEKATEEFIEHAVRVDVGVLYLGICLGLLAAAASWNRPDGYMNRLWIIPVLKTSEHLVAITTGALFGFAVVQLFKHDVHLGDGLLLAQAVILLGACAICLIVGAAYAEGRGFGLRNQPQARRLIGGTAFVALVAVLVSWR